MNGLRVSIEIDVDRLHREPSTIRFLDQTADLLRRLADEARVRAAAEAAGGHGSERAG